MKFLTHIKKNLLTIYEAAEVLGCSKRTVRRMIDDGQIDAFPLRKRKGSGIRIPTESIRNYIGRAINRYVLEEGILNKDQNSVTSDDSNEHEDLPDDEE